MARPYSLDLRERALARVQAGESVRAIARALSINGRSGSGRRAALRQQRWVAIGRGFWLAICRLSSAPDRSRGFHLARPCGGACRPWPQGGLSNRLDFRPRRGSELQKRPFCQASKTGLTSLASGPAGKPIKGKSAPGGSSSSVRLGPRQTWRHCAAGVCAENAFSKMVKNHACLRHPVLSSGL